jgi:uncharacterized protein (DUF1697 family)
MLYARRMRRYTALLRGVSPMNAKMPELVRAFEAAGFREVKTILSSGNVNFGCRASSLAALQQRAEAAMQAQLGKSFLTIVRDLSELERLLASDPYARFKPRPKDKRVVTFLREAPATPPKLPVSLGQARILSIDGHTAFSSYMPNPEDGPAFMKLIERTLGKDVSTRTWETLTKIVKAG